ncbi:hypothetical protein, partial [Kosakonia cowanii]|uniref:hypothetical protein n=1 Tax=Kosakonia cowanii TaxID=208223 RepID=UPI003EEC8934
PTKARHLALVWDVTAGWRLRLIRPTKARHLVLVWDVIAGWRLAPYPAYKERFTAGTTGR